MSSKPSGKKPARSRKSGRPTAEKNRDFREEILHSAEHQFAEHGFESVSLKDIAGPVGVTPAMVHYYFGNKQKLLITVLERAIEPLATAIAGLKQQDDPSAETFAMLLLETLGKNPNMPLLFIRQILMSGGSMQAHFVEKIAPRLGGALPGVLQKGQDSGRISSDLDPAISALLILSLCIFPHISKPLSQPALGVEFDPEGLSALHRHVARFISRGLAPP